MDNESVKGSAITISRIEKTTRIRQVILDFVHLTTGSFISLSDVGLWVVNIDPTDADGFHCPPLVTGNRSRFYYATKGGTIIRHPSAYSKHGWSSMVYHPAEYYTVTVGLGWLRSKFTIKQLVNAELDSILV